MSNFIKFVKLNSGSLLSQIILADRDFPKTDDIKTIAKYLYLKLDQDRTFEFQKLTGAWLMLEKGLASSPETLELINHITTLQTNDRNYPFAHQIPAHINNR